MAKRKELFSIEIHNTLFFLTADEAKEIINELDSKLKASGKAAK
jgi:hypothetical protein